MPTKIQWATDSWNPITGCSKISDGCKNCYAERMAKRLAGRYGYPKDNPFKPGTIHADKIQHPPKWGGGGKKIFVCSMGDLFHDDVPTYKTFGTIFDAAYMSGYGKFMVPRKPDYYLFLTKRPENMLKIVNYYLQRYGGSMPENCWFGVTAENQEQADKRIPTLLQIPAAVRFVSVEPMLGSISILKWAERNRESDDTSDIMIPGLHWVICGGETGPGARPMHPDWVRSLRDQCQAAGVPFFFKQWGEWITASFSNGHYDQDMGRNNAFWVDYQGVMHKPSSNGLKNPIAMFKVGKKSAGRLLDGREWSEYPK